MLEDFWHRACEQATVPLEVATKWFQQIISRYDSNGRFYHNDKLLNFKMNLLEPNVGSHIVFAIFFQYYEFDVRDFGYVENCDAFSKFYNESGIDNQILLESVLQLLGDPRFNNQQIENDLLCFQDMDLAIFGSSPDEYKMYANQLQKEYAHIDENTYKSMRLKAMQVDNKSFLSNVKDQAQSTPLKQFNGNNTPVSSNSTAKKKARKRKTFDNDSVVIDLTPPKTAKVNGSTFSNSDSDVEIIETVSEVIDLEDDDDISRDSGCNALDGKSSANTCAATATVSQTKQDETISVDTTVIPTDNLKEDCLKNAENNIVGGDLRENDSLPCSSKDLNLFIQDKTGEEHLDPPVYDMPTIYDMVSDDSFTCFDSTPNISSRSFDLTLNRASTLLSQISKNSLIVDVSDDLTLMPSPKRKQVASSSNMDDSVVFVSETLATTRPNVIPAPNFISLNQNPVRNAKRKQYPRNTSRKKTRFSPPTRTSSSAKNEKEPIKGTKRMVLIDGSNVAFNHGEGKNYSVEGIAICLDYFIQRGYETRAVLPEMRRGKFKSSNQDLLEKLHQEKKITFSPCKHLEGGRVSSYDDRVILEFACQLDAVVVSNDNYRDIRKEKQEFTDLVENRVIGYSFINDVIVIPPDPYGRNGPSLEEILTRREK